MLKSLRRLIPLAFLMLVLSACNSLSYYGQAINGHLNLVSHERPIDDVLKDKDTSEDLKHKLALAKEARVFASKQLALPDNDSYTSYADLGRPYAVWNVVATPRYSIESKTWCYLFVGCVSYRGYFDSTEAQTLANQLRTQGMDVIVSGAAAYSTLGWMDDPLLNTVVQRGDSAMVGIIFHELAHQVIYVEGDSEFNEAFATAVEYEGLRRWYKQQKNEQAYTQYRDNKAQQDMVYQQLQATRKKLAAVYAQAIPEQQKHQRKQQCFTELKTWYQAWRKTHSYAGFDGWMKSDLNNAHLALVATYQQMVPDFLSTLNAADGDMNKFYEIVKAMGPLDKAQRRVQLAAYRVRQQAKN